MLIIPALAREGNAGRSEVQDLLHSKLKTDRPGLRSCQQERGREDERSYEKMTEPSSRGSFNSKDGAAEASEQKPGGWFGCLEVDTEEMN